MAEELTKVAPPIVGKHSEQQAIITVPANGAVVIEVGSTNSNTVVALTGFAADYPPDTFRVRVAVPHPYIAPHEGILSPPLVQVVNQNFQRIEPPVGYSRSEHAFFEVENTTASDEELEICLGYFVMDRRTAQEYYARRWFKPPWL